MVEQQILSMVIIDHNLPSLEEIKSKFMLVQDIRLIDVANTAAEGINKIRIHNPNIIVFSHTLMDDDGFAFYNKVRSIAPYSIILPVLEVENPGIVTEYYRLRASYVFTRPSYTADKLIEMTKMCVKNEYQNGIPSNGASEVQSGPHAQVNYNPTPNMANGYPQQNAPFNPQAGNTFQPQINYGIPPMGGAPISNNPTQSQFAPSFNAPMGGDGKTGYQQQYGNSFQPSNNFGGQFNTPDNFTNNDPFGNSNMSQPDTTQKSGFRSVKHKIVAINSPKGGVGKSTLVKELSSAFSTVKFHGQPYRVCVVDLNIGQGDLASMLFKKNAFPNIMKWSEDIQKRLDAGLPEEEIKYSPKQINDEYLISINDNFKMLAARNYPPDKGDIHEIHIKVILENLKNCNFDIIILDTGNNQEDPAYVAMMKATDIIMVITLDITTIDDTIKLLDSLLSSRISLEKIQVVYNKRPKNEDYSLADLEEVFRKYWPNRKNVILECIPDIGDKMRVINNNGTPLVLSTEDAYTDTIKRIGNYIVPVFNRKLDSVPKKSLLSKLLKRDK